MYNMICTENDVLRERFIAGAELTGRYGFPQLKLINADVTGLKSVPFHMAAKEKVLAIFLFVCITVFI